MNSFQNERTGIITAPAARVNNATFTTATIDTAGYTKLLVKWIVGATDIAMTAFKLQESDDSGMANATDIAGAVYGATGAAALPTASDSNKIFAFHVDLKGRKRFIKLVATIGNGAAGQFACGSFELGNGLKTTDTNAERGFAALQIVPAL